MRNRIACVTCIAVCTVAPLCLQALRGSQKGRENSARESYDGTSRFAPSNSFEVDESGATQNPRHRAYPMLPVTPSASDDAEPDKLRRRTEQDVRSAADAALELSAGPQRDEALAHVAIVWANQNLPEAIAWARHLSIDSEKHAALTKIAYEAARSDAAQAIAIASDLPDDPVRAELILHAAAQWGSTAPEAAAEWGKSIPNPSLRESVLAAIAPAWGDHAPEKAASMVSHLIPTGTQQDHAVVGIIQRWAQKTPENAAAWVERFEENALREIACEHLVGIWAGANPKDAGNWLNELPASLSRDYGIAAYTIALSTDLPAEAARWAESITNNEIRNSQFERIAERWLSADAGQATSWIMQLPFPEAVRLNLRDRVQ
jgi:hypothetical protein